MSEEIISTDSVPKHPEEGLSASEQEAAHQRERAEELQKLLSASEQEVALQRERANRLEERIESVVFRYKEMFGEDELYVRFQTKTKQIEADRAFGRHRDALHDRD
jgi:hypothetical protein